MINIKRNLVLSAMALLLVGSFLLPNAVAGITDSSRLNNITTIDSQSIVVDSTPALSLPERIALTANPNAELLAWRSGNNMDAEAAERRAVLELARFLRGGSFVFDFHNCSVDESSAVFIIDPEIPTLSMVVWELTLVDAGENTAILTIDDETGVILKIIYKQARQNGNGTGAGSAPVVSSTDENLHAAALELIGLMEEYYHLTIILADYYFRSSLSYYRADIPGHNPVVRMFGVVRATSFTMNERP